MSKRYALGEFKEVSDLPTVGNYARNAWALWIARELPETEPRDKILGAVWRQIGGVPRAGKIGSVEVLSTKGVMELTGIGRTTISKAFNAGELPGKFIGGSKGWTTTRRAVLEWAEGRNK